jgi:hypothetical protein
MMFPLILKILELIIMVGKDNLKIGRYLGDNLEEIYYYFEFLNKFEIPRPNQKKTENWILDYSDWKKNKDNNVRLLKHKIETSTKYANKIQNKFDKDWVNYFHISDIVQVKMLEDLDKELFNFNLDEHFFLK